MIFFQVEDEVIEILCSVGQLTSAICTGVEPPDPANKVMSRLPLSPFLDNMSLRTATCLCSLFYGNPNPSLPQKYECREMFSSV